ncbi:MAG: uroporphyrinogen decarboxylase [Clostridiaceae bacterium BRH_c20a]|nr:MAG: uroporphyrinogen decarboxylase [Clostridiaceae bacterium BRH_c20a]
MNSRERVNAVLNHKKPDRAPLDLCNSASFINDTGYFALKEHLKIEGDIDPFRKGFTATYYDERVLEALEIDFRHIWLNPPEGYQPKKFPDGTIQDEWGYIYKFSGNERAIINTPLKGFDESDLDKYPWPDPYAPGRINGLTDRAKFLFDNTSYAVAAHAPHSLGLFDNGWILRGFQDFMMDLVFNKKFIHKLLDKILERIIGLHDVYLDAVGPYIQTIAHCEDYGMQNAPFISPKMYQEFFLPLHKELFSFIKKKAPHVKIMLHSCGAVYPLIPYFVEAGIDILNPIQHTANGMDPGTIKREFGNRLVFHGGIDIQRALCGSLTDIEEEAISRINDLGRDGGYIVAPANVVQNETPPENIVACYKTAREYSFKCYSGK